MAIDTDIFGFETKDASCLNSASAVSASMTAAAARSGAYGFDRLAGKFAILPINNTLLGGAYVTYDYRFRVFFRMESYPNVTDFYVCGESQLNVRLQMNTGGQIRLYSPGAPQGTTYPYEGGISLGRWYRADFRIYGYTGSGLAAGRRQERVNVYDDTGALVNALRSRTQIEVPNSATVSNWDNPMGCADNVSPSYPRHGPTRVINGFNSAGFSQAVARGLTGVYGITVSPQVELSGPATTYVNDSEFNGYVCNRWYGINGTLSDKLYELGTMSIFNEPFTNFFMWNGSMAYGNVILGQEGGGATNTAHVYYDDIWYELRTGVDVDGIERFPIGTKIYGFVPTSQGTFDQFTPAGSYNLLQDLPDTGTFVTSSTVGAQTTYRHAIQALTDRIYFLKLICNCYSSPTAAQSFMINGVEYSVAGVSNVSNAGNFTSVPHVSLSYLSAALTPEAFAVMEFGGKHGVTAGEFRLYNLLFEALTGPIDPLIGEVTISEAEAGDPGTYLIWAEFTDALNALHVYSKVALADPQSYYGGYKEGIVLQWGRLTRALSSYNGSPEGIDFSFTLSDTDRKVRGLLAADTTKYFMNRSVVMRTISDDARRALLKPRTIMRGVVSGYKPLAGLQFRFSAQDVISRRFNAVQSSQQQVPDLAITVADFPNGLAVASLENPSVPVTVGLRVPVVFGNLTDTNYVSVPGPAAGSIPFDATIPPVDSKVLNGIGGSVAYQLGNPAGRPVYVWLFAIRNGLGGPVDFPMSTEGWLFGNPPDPLSTTGVKASWNHVEGANSYRLIFADARDFDPHGNGVGSATKARYIDHDATTFDGYYPGWDFSIDLPDYTVGTDMIGATTPVLVDQGHGVYIPLYAGTAMIAGQSYHTFIVSRGACAGIDEMYSEGTTLKLQTDATIAGAGAPWLVPGYPGWNTLVGPQKYVDINGHRYTLIYGLVGSILPDRAAGVADLVVADAVAFAINLRGLTTKADGTGTLVDVVIDQKLLALQNFGPFGSYGNQSAWLTTPAFGDDPLTPQIDEQSFVNAKAVIAIKGAGVLGENGESISVKEMIARFNISADIDGGYNRKCQYFVSAFDDSAATIAAASRLTDVYDIVKDSFDIEDELDAHFNIVPYAYSRDYSGKTADGWNYSLEKSDSDSIEKYSSPSYVAELRMGPLLLYFVRDTAQALIVATRRLDRHKDPPRLASWRVTWAGFNHELGDIFKVDYFGGVGSAGYKLQPMRLIRLDADPDHYSIDFQAWVMRKPVSSLGGSTTILNPDGTMIPNSQIDLSMFGPLLSKWPQLYALSQQSKEAGIGPTNAVNSVDVVLDGTGGITFRAYVRCRTDRTTLSITPQIFNVTDNVVEAAGVACNATDPNFEGTNQQQILPIAPAGVKTYRLRYTLNNPAGTSWMDGQIVQG